MKSAPLQGTAYIGASLRRKEDRRLLTGAGQFVADVRRPGMLHAAVVRSTHAHARLLSIDTTKALALDGVVAVITAADLPERLDPIPLRLTSYPGMSDCLQPVLATDRVRYVGEPVAVVVAESRYLAEDGADELRIQYDPLPAVASVTAALAHAAPVLHPARGHNVGCAFEQRVGDVEQALAGADLILEERFATNRHAAVPMECRGLVAEFDPQTGRLTVWGAAKVPHFNRRVLARLMAMEESAVRLIEVDVGGGFGARGEFYPEDFLIPFLAKRLGRPVGWVEDRREHLMATNHSRQMEFRVRVGVKADGTILGLHVQLDNDHGAYVRTHGATVPEIGSALIPGPYRIPHFLAEVRCVMTNKTPTGTYRSPGRYEGTFMRERLLDMIARNVGLDPAEVRRRNMITPDEMPYHVGTGGLSTETVYDSGDYRGLLETALQAIDYNSFRQRQAAARAQGRWLGAGIGAFVEKSGLGPWEYARVEVTPEGRTVLYTGGSSVGQGVVTVLAQITADGLGVTPDEVDVVYGDTDRVPKGNGAFASRVTVVGGTAALQAGQKVKEQVLRVAAGLLEAAPEDLELVRGQIKIKGTERGVTLAEAAKAAGGFSVEHVFDVAHMTYPGGVHACEVEVDPQTGAVKILRYAIAYDIGRAINPMLVAGQLQGGLGQGIGGALHEELAYSEDGQLLTGTFMDYLLPTAQEVPEAHLAIMENTPTPLNPLGAKGSGEGGCTGAGGCLANAIADAIAPSGAEVRRLPLSPAEIHRLIRTGPREE